MANEQEENFRNRTTKLQERNTTEELTPANFEVSHVDGSRTPMDTSSQHTQPAIAVQTKVEDHEKGSANNDAVVKTAVATGEGKNGSKRGSGESTRNVSDTDFEAGEKDLEVTAEATEDDDVPELSHLSLRQASDASGDDCTIEPPRSATLGGEEDGEMVQREDNIDWDRELSVDPGPEAEVSNTYQADWNNGDEPEMHLSSDHTRCREELQQYRQRVDGLEDQLDEALLEQGRLQSILERAPMLGQEDSPYYSQDAENSGLPPNKAQDLLAELAKVTKERDTACEELERVNRLDTDGAGQGTLEYLDRLKEQLDQERNKTKRLEKEVERIQSELDEASRRLRLGLGFAEDDEDICSDVSYATKERPKNDPTGDP